MAQSLDIEVAETKRFELDCALYSFQGKRKERALETLSADPAIGRPYSREAPLWLWTVGEFDLIYAISGDFSKIVLVELRPRSLRQGRLLDRVFDTIERVNALKRLFGL